MRVEYGAPAVMLGFEGGDGGDWIFGPGGGVERVRLNRKTPAHLVRRGIFWIQSRPRVWKRLRVQDHSRLMFLCKTGLAIWSMRRPASPGCA